MGKINLLDDRIINKIAAGEVVENPASVIKELCENSIDAGATSITVEFSKGGTEYIRIIDNGSGMEPEDAINAFIRHATSKLKNEQDLDNIATMGFRGEALASISEVSEVELNTSDGETGTLVLIRGGKREDLREIGFPRGTTIEVRNLFFNTPARKKFLKSPRQETNNILELCQRLILSHPSVSFRIINNGKLELKSQGTGELADAVCAVYGSQSREELVPVDFTTGDIRVSGFASKPAFAQLNRKRQSFFVNSRYVKSPLLSASLDEAFKGMLMINKYPWAVLSIEIPYNEVDVNVHPQKTEVRFENSKAVFQAIINAINNSFNPDDVIPEVKIDDEPIKASIQSPNVTINISDRFDDEPQQFALDNPPEKQNTEKTEEKTLDTSEKASDSTLSEKTAEEQILKDKIKSETVESETENISVSGKAQEQTIPTPIIKAEFVPQTSTRITADKPKNAYTAQITNEKVKPLREAFGGFTFNSADGTQSEQIMPEENYTVVGVLWDTYIIVQSGNDCYVIDQHAAHERFLFDKYSEQFNNRRVLVQELLIPDVVEVTSEETELVIENSETFAMLGFEIEPFGNRSIIIRGVPSVACEAPFTVVLQEAIELLKSNMSCNNVINDIMCQKLMQTACKHAVKGNQKLTDKEIRFILNSIKSLKGLTCPHGRPIAISLTRKEMEKRFGRIQN